MLNGYKRFVRGLFFVVIGAILTWYTLTFGAYKIIYFLTGISYLFGIWEVVAGIMVMYKKKYN